MAGVLSKLRKSFSLRRSTSQTSTATMGSSGDSNNRFGTSRRNARLSTQDMPRALSGEDTCPICLGCMRPGSHGHALFTAECVHTFHFHCITDAFRHGYPFCPVCRRYWVHNPIRVPPRPVPVPASPPAVIPPEPQHFDDDQPLLLPPPASSTPPPPSALPHIRTFTEHPALPASQSRPEFSVLVSLRAPSLQPPAATGRPRAPVDLVTVLDVSGSMEGLKLALLKRAVGFVAHQLGPADRLSVVAFSTSAKRVLPLSRMTPEGQDLALRAVESLDARGGTDIIGGLRKGVRVLEERRERNHVSSIILLSDGQDSYSYGYRHYPGCDAGMRWRELKYIDLLPLSVQCRRNGEVGSIKAVPIHSFGIGADHDAPIMHAISDATGGTFSYIEEEGSIQDAFAQCIGGLLTVVAQEVQLSLTSAFHGVGIGRIPAGNHSTRVSGDRRRGTIFIGDLYADEVKDFLVHVSVPADHRRRGGGGSAEATMPLLTVRCSYKDPITSEAIHVEKRKVKIERPEAVVEEDLVMCVEVDRQRKRIHVAEGIAAARGLADNGDLEGAQRVLTDRIESLLTSQLMRNGDELCKGLEAELEEVRDRIASKEAYEAAGGRAYLLSGMSSHLWQRATTRGSSHSGGCGTDSGRSRSMSMGYETPSMTQMVIRSQTLSFPPSPAARPGDVAQVETQSTHV